MESLLREQDFRRLAIDAAKHVSIAAVGVGGAAAFARASAVAGGDLGAFYPLKALAWLALIAAFTLPTLREHLPHARFGPANQVTLLRAGLIALIGGALGEAALHDGGSALSWAAFALALTAFGLDAVDGWVARRRRCASAFGARFDMELDAIFTLILALMLFDTARAGAWVLAAGLWRYVFVGARLGLPWLRRPLPPSARRRAVCAIAVVALLAGLAPPLDAASATVAAAIAVAALSYSFIADIVWLARRRGRPRA